MKFWGSRKRSFKHQPASLSMEKLEDRTLMAVIPLISGQAATFRDADGTQVNVRLVGPGQGSIELVGGVFTGAAIDTLTLTGTTGQSRLKISTRGGTVRGTTINDVVIDNALNELGALKHFKGKKVTLTGDFTADGDIDEINLRGLGNGASFEVDGDVGRVKMETLASNSNVEVAGVLKEFVAKLLSTGSEVSADQLDLLKIKRQAFGATFDVGAGGIARAKIGWIYDTALASEGSIGDVVVKGDAMGVKFASNIDAGSDGILGTIDDYVIDPALSGYIRSIKFGGSLGAQGTNQEVEIVTSGVVGDVKLGRTAQKSGAAPKLWEQAAQSIMPLSVVQQYASATGYSDENIWISVFGTDLTTLLNYYLSPNHINNGIPALQLTNSTATTNTPDLPLINSYTLTEWKNANSAWGSSLAFPVPAENEQWSGRILISIGVPVQAQINGNGTVASPSASNSIDPSSGTFYDFLEFTASGPAYINGKHIPANLDIDTSQVDEFGLPVSLQLYQMPLEMFNGTVSPSSNMITGIQDTSGLVMGQTVSGQYIAPGTTITNIVPATTNKNGSITISTNANPTAAVSELLMAYTPPSSYDVQIQGTIGPNSNVISGISSDTLNSLILNSNVSTSQPITASGVLPEGTTISSYVIGTSGQNDSTITLTKDSLSSVTSGNFTFTIEPAGAVGVSALRQSIMGTGQDSMLSFLQNEINGGNSQALPFLQTAYPYLLSGPVPIFGVVPTLGAIEVETTGTGVLASGDLVQISGVLGNTVANGVYAIDAPSATTFTISYPISNGPYTGGGTVSVVNPQLITGAATSPVQITTNTVNGLVVNSPVALSGITGMQALAGNFIVAGIGSDSFTLGGPTSTGTYTDGTGYWFPAGAPITPVSGVTNTAGGFEIATPNTDYLVVNQLVLISGVNGLPDANGAFTVTSVGANSFTVSGTSGSGSYTSGGAWQAVEPITKAIGTASSAIEITTKTPSLFNGTVVQIGGVEGVEEANGLFIASTVTGTGFTLGSPVSTTAYTNGGMWSASGNGGQVDFATLGGEVMITTPTTPNVVNGEWITVSGVAGNTAANGSYKVRDLSGSTFLLEGTQGSGSYTFGGIFYAVPSVYEPISTLTGNSVDQIMVSVASSAGITPSSTVLIQGVSGNTAANGLFLIDNLVPSTMSTNGTFQIGAPVGNGNYNENAWSMAITGAGTNPAYVAVSNTTGLSVGDTITFNNVQGSTSINGSFDIAALDSNWITLGAPVGNHNYTSGGYWTLPNSSASIIGGSSTTGQPVVITTGNTAGLSNGDLVQIAGTSGNSAINGVFAISSVTGTTFTIASVNGNGAAISGGNWQVVEAITDVTDQGDPIVITSANTDAIKMGGVVTIFDVGGNTNANNTFVVTDKSSSTITLGSPAGLGAYVKNTGMWTGGTNGSGSVSDAINGGSVEIHTSNTTGLNEGDLIQVTDVSGNTGANGVYTVTNVKQNVFTLSGSLSTGTYTLGGTWKEFGSIPRLVSPKDLVEALSSPHDEGELNNYFNEVIDDFFLQYLPSTDSVNGFAGGGQILQVTSSASGVPVVYNGIVTNSSTANGGYVLRFSPSGSGAGPTSYNPDTLDIYYPFFNTNAPSPDVYTPLFGVEEPPTWIVDLGKQNESATQMLFACDAVFADNTARKNLGMSSAASTVVADLENLVSGAFNRGIAFNPGDTWGDSTAWFPENGRYNYWVQYWHRSGLMYGDLAYAFAFDDKFGASTNLQINTPGLTQITLGGWGTTTMTASTTTLTLTLPPQVPQPVSQNQSVTLTATVSGTSPTGSVTFFVNGIPITTGNDSNSAPLEPVPVSGNTATITTNLPTLPDGTTMYNTYTITAVYSGDNNYLPSIDLTTIEVNG